MTREEVYVRLNKILQNEDIIVCDSTCVEDMEDGDSFEKINFLVAVEQEFALKFDIKEAKNFKNIGEMVDAIIARSDSGTQV